MREAGLNVPYSPDYRLDRRSRLARSLPEGRRGIRKTPRPRGRRTRPRGLFLTETDMLFSYIPRDGDTMSLAHWSLTRRVLLAATIAALIWLGAVGRCCEHGDPCSAT